MKVDHTKSKITEALGFPLSIMDDIRNKFEPLLQKFEEEKKLSYIYEEILEKFTYNEVVYLAGQYVIDRLSMFEIHKQSEIDAMIKKILKQSEN